MHASSPRFYLFDCDGVLWRDSEPIPHARDLLVRLHTETPRANVLFVTNGTAGSRKDHAAQLTQVLSLPFAITEEQVIMAGHVTAQFLSRQLAPSSCVLLVGREPLRAELERVGLRVIHVAEALEAEQRIDFAAVVIGNDPQFTYHHMTLLMRVLRGNPACLFVTCNMDAAFPAANGQFMPGTGAIATAVAYASEREPIVIGKPSSHMMAAIRDVCPEFDARQAVFVGDRLDSDIAFANANGMASVLVETGAHQRKHIRDIVPGRCIATLEELL